MKKTAPTIILAVWLTALTLHGAVDALPSWNDGAVKQSILSFVSDVTTPGKATFVPSPERIAVFDNDGTLCVEQPAYIQCCFGVERVKAVAAQHPEWREQEPFKSALAGDLKGVLASGVRGLTQLPSSACAGLTLDEYDRVVRDWLANSRHPRYARPYTECVYQPMLELLALLRTNGFKSFVVSGGTVEFMRVWTEKVYGVPPERVIGSAVSNQFELRNRQAVMVRRAEIELVNDKVQKALSIDRVIGRRPILAFGNSDGDLPMLQWTASGGGRRFCAFVHHTEGQREYAYDRNSPIGRLDKGLDEVTARGWTVVDMKRDWNRVFPFEAASTALTRIRHLPAT